MKRSYTKEWLAVRQKLNIYWTSNTATSTEINKLYPIFVPVELDRSSEVDISVTRIVDAVVDRVESFLFEL
jgi:hypothetical protein